MPKQDSRAATIGGLALAGTGLAHFGVPQLFEGMTKAAFPTDTRAHVYIETAVGLGLAAQRTRKLAILGLIGYLLYLTGNAVRNR